MCGSFEEDNLSIQITLSWGFLSVIRSSCTFVLSNINGPTEEKRIHTECALWCFKWPLFWTGGGTVQNRIVIHLLQNVLVKFSSCGFYFNLLSDVASGLKGKSTQTLLQVNYGTTYTSTVYDAFSQNGLLLLIHTGHLSNWFGIAFNSIQFIYIAPNHNKCHLAALQAN